MVHGAVSDRGVNGSVFAGPFGSSKKPFGIGSPVVDPTTLGAVWGRPGLLNEGVFAGPFGPSPSTVLRTADRPFVTPGRSFGQRPKIQLTSPQIQ